ncbi:MAG: glutathione S-transferase family protein [Hyphomicrobiales bacterium]
MSEYQLHCLAESGNAYKAALMLELCGLDWSSILIDFPNGEMSTEEFRRDINLFGEIPVLEHKDLRLSQTGVILKYLSEKTGQFGPANKLEEYEILRWILFDNHKFTSYMATRRFALRFMKTGDTEVTNYLHGRIKKSLEIVEKHLADRDFIATPTLSIADISLCGYLYYGEELEQNLGIYANINAWLDRIAATDGWKHPYELMPRAYPV